MMSKKDVLLPLLPFVIFIVAIAGIPFFLSLTDQSTGVCIFKGPATTGFLSSSDGVPLRGIGVTAWHPGGFGGQIIDAAGSTDRNGCFIFKMHSGTNEYLSYSYNGTSYVDSVQAGVVLRHNLP